MQVLVNMIEKLLINLKILYFKSFVVIVVKYLLTVFSQVDVLVVVSDIRNNLSKSLWYCVSDIMRPNAEQKKKYVCSVKIKLMQSESITYGSPVGKGAEFDDEELAKLKNFAQVMNESPPNVPELEEEKYTCDEAFSEKEHLHEHDVMVHGHSKNKFALVKKDGENLSTKKQPVVESKEPPKKKRKLTLDESSEENADTVSDSKPDTENRVEAIEFEDESNGNYGTAIAWEDGQYSSDEEFILVEGNTDGLGSMQCPKCRETFDEEVDVGIFEKHIELCKICKCNHCDKEFGSELVLERHIKIFHSKFDFECEYCVRKFCTKDELAVHGTTYHKLIPKKRPKTEVKPPPVKAERMQLIGGQYKCDRCDEIIQGDEEWMAHIALHNFSDVPIQCDLCPKTFETEKQMHAHKKNVHDILEKSYAEKSCAICNKDFNSTTNYKIHMIEKHGHKGRYGCEVCGKQYQSKARFEDHKANHSKERPHICPTCGRTYKTKRNLDDHMRIHTDSEGFTCGKCGKLFKTKGYLQVHMLHTHPDTRRFHCDICGKLFKTKNVLDVHIEYHLNEMKYQCDYCDKRFNAKKNLQSHVKKHLKHI